MGDRLITDVGYGLIPRRLMRDCKLSGYSKLIYSYLSSFAGTTYRAFPSVSLITKELDISTDTFYKYLKELKEYGAIEVKQSRTESGSFGKNIYILKTEQYLRIDPIEEEKTISPYTVWPDTVRPDTDATVSDGLEANINNTNNNKYINNNKSEYLKDSKESLCPTGVERGEEQAKSNIVLDQDTRDLIINKWNQLNLQNIRAINPDTNRYKMLRVRVRDYGLDAVMEAIDEIHYSDFLQGQNKNGWTITFDWFIRPNNFIKVLEGNYRNEVDDGTGSTRPAKQSTGEIDYAQLAGITEL